MLYLVIAEVKNTPPPASLASLEQGLATLERLDELTRDGTVLAVGVFAGRMGMSFTVDVASNNELHQVVATLPTFMQAEWQTIPLVSLADDLAMTRAALEHLRTVPDTRG